MNDIPGKSKTGWMLVTYAIILYVALSHLHVVLSFLGGVVRLLSPFLYGIAIAYILNILMRLFDRLYAFFDRSRNRVIRKLKRPLSILSVFIALAILVYALMAVAIPNISSSVSSLANNIPRYLNSFENFLNSTVSQLGLAEGFWKSVSVNWNDVVQKAGTFVADTFPRVFGFTAGLGAWVVNMSTGILISIYLLATKERLLLSLRKLIYAWLPKKLGNRVIDLAVMSNRIFMGYFSGLIVNALLVAALCFVGMLIFGVPYAFLVSIVIGITAIIPVLGPIAGSVLGIIITLLVAPDKALAFSIFIILLQEIDSFAIYPKVVGGSTGLGGLWLLAALIVGGSLFGIIGIIAGIPALAVIYAFVRKMTHERLQKKNISLG